MSASAATDAHPPTRSAYARPTAPVRLVHLGVGNFFRAHQAWYTEHAPDADGWGIAAFTGRSAAVADTLARQDGLYTLLVRGSDGSRTEVVGSLSAVHAGDDLSALRRYLQSAEVAAVTLTVTEAGYRRNAAGDLDVEAADVQHDLAVFRGERPGLPVTTPGRLVDGLRARARAGTGPIAVVPCDNVSGNGAMVRRVVGQLAQLVDPALATWVEENVSFVTTMVDRITPRTTDADTREVRELTGLDDAAVVVTEPFSEWVLSGHFPAGRPGWDAAGARFVDDIEPFEHRKLWLLNGAHSTLAYAGSVLGYTTVADAIGDPELLGWVEQWWNDAAGGLPLPPEDVSAYRQALLTRFANPQIRHLLSQIATDGSLKIPIRAVPVLLSARERGQLPIGATRLVAAWIAHLRGHGAPVADPNADELAALVSGPAGDAVVQVLSWLGVDDVEVTALVERHLEDLETRADS